MFVLTLMDHRSSLNHRSAIQAITASMKQYHTTFNDAFIWQGFWFSLSNPSHQVSFEASTWRTRKTYPLNNLNDFLNIFKGDVISRHQSNPLPQKLKQDLALTIQKNVRVFQSVRAGKVLFFCSHLGGGIKQISLNINIFE